MHTHTHTRTHTHTHILFYLAGKKGRQAAQEGEPAAEPKALFLQSGVVQVRNFGQGPKCK